MLVCVLVIMIELSIRWTEDTLDFGTIIWTIVIFLVVGAYASQLNNRVLMNLFREKQTINDYDNVKAIFMRKHEQHDDGGSQQNPKN